MYFTFDSQLTHLASSATSFTAIARFPSANLGLEPSAVCGPLIPFLTDASTDSLVLTDFFRNHFQRRCSLLSVPLTWLRGRVIEKFSSFQQAFLQRTAFRLDVELYSLFASGAWIEWALLSAGDDHPQGEFREGAGT